MNDDITVKDLGEKQREVFKAKAEYEAAKQESNSLFAKFKILQSDHIERLESLAMKSYKTDAGNFSFTMVESVSLDQENKDEFWDYLREKGLFNSMITINSATLNSWAKQEFAEQEESGSLDPQVPGLNKKPPFAKASMRKS